MDQLKKLLASLTLRQKITILAAAAAVGVSLFAFTNWRRERDFRPLFSGLAAEDAGAVVQKLRETGVDYRLSDSGAVSVPSARVAELRLQMASAGLPKNGRAGYELFDKNNFGVTDFAEHVNYRRALEGELERSIMSLTEVEQARVHLTFPKDSVFLESRQPGKASVMVGLRAGARLSQANVLAIAYLVASAVEGLAPDAVTVVDRRGDLLSRPRTSLDGGEAAPEATLDFKRQIEKDLIAKINSTLEPLLGPDKFRAGASVECDFSGGEQSEESFDPSRSVMVSSQKTEDVSGTNLASGTPGTASNLPRPVSRPGVSGLGATRRTESIAYQSSRTVRRIRLPQGTLKRMSLTVLLDQTVRWQGTGPNARRIIEPPAPEKLKVIREVVAAATGFTAERGDQMIVDTLPFEATLNLEPPAPRGRPSPNPPGGQPAWLEPWLNNKPLLIGVAAGAALLLIASLGLFGFLLRRKRRQHAAPVTVRPALPEGAQAPALESASTSLDVEKKLEAKLAEQLEARDRKELEAMLALKLPQVATKKTEVLSKHIVESTRKDPAAAAQVLRGWLREKET